MAVDPNLPEMSDCGCCAGLEAQTPVEIANRAGLAAIAYRAGTHAQFKGSMLAALSSTEREALQALQTRDDDDFSIALLDAWATVADVLTFYQERIANESYLRTATERFSLLELARLIGYELRPGVAASTYLAFTVEDAPGSLPRATVDIGTKAQSIPGPGEQAQTFEAIEKIEARGAWNAIKPRLGMRQVIKGDASKLLFAGITTSLKAGDGLLLKPDDDGDAVFRTITEVIPHPGPLPEQQRTEVRLQPLPPAFVFVPGLINPVFNPSHSVSLIANQYLNQTVNAVDFQAFAQIQNFQVTSIFGNLVATQPQPPSVLALRLRASIFGYHAPNWQTLPIGQRIGEKHPDSGDFLVGVYSNRNATWVDLATEVGIVDRNLDDFPGETSTGHIYLDQTYPSVVKGSWIVLKNGKTGATRAYQVTATAELSKTNFAMTAKVVRLTLSPAKDLDVFAFRTTTVYAQSEELALARQPIETPVSGKLIELDGFVDGLAEGQPVIVCGELEEERGTRACEAVVIAKVEHVLAANDGFTQITLTTALGQAYVRDTVTINANVARATHGETTQEVLGGGEASRPYQRFTLRQPPLTHTSAATPSGTASSLQIRVNDVLWHEAPSLYGHGPDERIFISRLGDDGKTTVVFGDGRTGARLPTGQENVRATYRKGIGRGGLVKAEQISMLLTRPLGVKGVLNPLASSGAADAETLAGARANAPLTVMTLERIVSLQDYEDFARAYAGIAKSHATWTWNGQMRGVFVTVAGPDGAEVKPDSDLYKNLLAAMQQAGDPHVPLRVKTYRPAFFRLAAGVKVNPDFLPDKVLAAVEQALREQFSFTARQFGQPVALSEVVAVMQSVAGIIAVDVDKLYRFDDTSAGLKMLLPAAAPQAGDKGTIAAAELLRLDPSPLHDFGVMP
jgi:predicted phage baseplate assembly protein